MTDSGYTIKKINVVFLFFRADLPHYRLITNSLTPKMEFIADYVMKGRILVLPIQGKGIANVTMGKLRLAPSSGE